MPDANLVAVTGGTGFVGRVLVQQLFCAGYRVRVLTRRRRNVANLLIAEQVESCVGDLLNPASLRDWVDGAAVVYHLAGEIRDPSRFTETNVQGTRNVVAACQSAGVRHLVYLSSVGVTGADGSIRFVDETTPAQPRNSYEISKYAAETQVLRSGQADFRVSVVRPSIVFGEGKKSGRDSFLSLVRWINAGRMVMLGRNYVSSYIYVGDVAAVCQRVAADPQCAGQIYIVNEPVPLTALVNEIAALLHVRRPMVLPEFVSTGIARLLNIAGRFGSLYNRTVFSRAKLDTLAFQLPYGYREGLRRTIGWYRQENLL